MSIQHLSFVCPTTTRSKPNLRWRVLLLMVARRMPRYLDNSDDVILNQGGIDTACLDILFNRTASFLPDRLRGAVSLTNFLITSLRVTRLSNLSGSYERWRAVSLVQLLESNLALKDFDACRPPLSPPWAWYLFPQFLMLPLVCLIWQIVWQATTTQIGHRRIVFKPLKVFERLAHSGGFELLTPALWRPTDQFLAHLW